MYIVRPEITKIEDRSEAIEGVAGAGVVLIRPVDLKVNGARSRMI